MNALNLPSYCRLERTLALFVFSLLALAGCGGETTGDEELYLSIASPEADSIQTESQVLIRGTVYGTNHVEVNGESADVADDGQWEITLGFDDGEVTATAVAEDEELSVTFYVDTAPPDLHIEYPPRGTMIDSVADDSSILVVQGSVVDAGPSGLDFILVDGEEAQVGEDGSFEAEVSLDIGYNLISIVSRDGVGHEHTIRRAVVYGPLAAADAPIEEAARVDVTNPEGTNSLAEVIAAYLTAEEAENFIVAGFEEENIPVEITDVTWEELDVAINTGVGVVELEATLTGFRIDGEFQYDDDSDLVEGYVEIAETTAYLDVVLSATDDQNLDVEVTESEMDLDPEDVTVDVGGESPDWLSDILTVVILFSFEEFVAELIEDHLYDPAMLSQEIEFFNRTVEIEFLLEEVVITPNGLSLFLGLEFPAEKHHTVADVPGALHRELGPLLGGSLFQPLSFHSTRTTMDRLLHGLWRSGLLHQDLGNEELAETSLPFELTADGLGSLLDSRIRDIHETNTPAEIRFRPLLSPVVEFSEEGEESDGTAYVGDFLIDFLLRPDASTETRFLTVALHLEVEFALTIEDGELGFDFDVEAIGEVADEPVISFDHDDVVKLITDLIELVPNLLAGDLSFDIASTIEWATFSDPEVLIHGEWRDRVSAGLELTPAEEFIEDDALSGD